VKEAQNFTEAARQPPIEVWRPPAGYVLLVWPDGSHRGVSVRALEDPALVKHLLADTSA
jgi:hypothetical protein